MQVGDPGAANRSLMPHVIIFLVSHWGFDTGAEKMAIQIRRARCVTVFPADAGWILGIAIAMVPCIAPAAVFRPVFPLFHSVRHSAHAIGLLGPTAGNALDDAGGDRAGFRHLLPQVLAGSPGAGPQFLSFRIVNRAMVAGMLWLLSRVLGMWLEAERLPAGPAVVRRVRSRAAVRSVRCSAC